MNLENLNDLNKESKDHEHKFNQLTEGEKYIASLRKSDKDLTSIVFDLNVGRSYGGREISKNLLIEVLNDQKHELLRLVELRLSAQAREQKIKAAQKQCLVEASIIQTEDI